MIDGRCPRCDREGCPRVIASAVFDAAVAIWSALPIDPREPYDAAHRNALAAGSVKRDAAFDCERNAVDWRARCLVAESKLAAMEVMEREARRVAKDKEPDHG